MLLRYVDNPNGSRGDVAGVTNAEGNVLGLMPHPEHAVDELLGSTDGRTILQGLQRARRAARAHARLSRPIAHATSSRTSLRSRGVPASAALSPARSAGRSVSGPRTTRPFER